MHQQSGQHSVQRQPGSHIYGAHHCTLLMCRTTKGASLQAVES